MLQIEDYISHRKKEYHLDEFDINLRNENMKTCVNYVFDNFNNYLDISSAEEITALHSEKIDKYGKQLQGYNKEIQDWFVSIYTDHGDYLNRAIMNELKNHDFFFLLNMDQEFRSI
jgi:hypothetical protein